MVFLIPLLLLLTSCGQVSYLWEQGLGQLSIQRKARDNHLVLADKTIPPEYKEKIRLIARYKEYFYQYFSKTPTSIYSKTTILKDKAVSYLVIASPYQEIKAIEHWFPFFGKFPYLGFFALDSAQEYAKDQEKEGRFVYIRPVYAYSTLGYLEDSILSSFFVYDDYELAELIFHELFHTIFFVKDEVKLNENLANFFSHKMTLDYFHHSFQDREDLMKKREQLAQEMVRITHEFQQKLKQAQPESKNQAQTLLDKFLLERLTPHFEKICQNLKLKDDCFPLRRKWNHASLAAYLTYQQKSNQIEKLYQKLSLDLPGFLKYLETKHQEAKDDARSLSESLFSL